MLSFLIVDDHPMVQYGISALLMSKFDGSQCVISSSVEEAVVYLNDHTPNFIFLDLGLPGVKGVQAVRLLCDLCPNIPVLVFSASEEGGIVQRCIGAGASWFLCKSRRDDEIFAVVNNLVHNKEFYEPVHLSESTKRQLQMQCVDSLTSRQIEVLILMQQGCLNKQIAYKLGCAENTVKVHSRSIFRVLGVNTRSQAVEKALSLGMFDRL